MSKDQHSAQDFDRIFQEKLSGHQAAPPAEMWEKINSRTADSKRRRGLLWIITNDTSLMFLILLLSFFGFAGGERINTGAAETTNVSSESVEKASTQNTLNTESIKTRTEAEFTTKSVSEATDEAEMENALAIEEEEREEKLVTGSTSSESSNAKNVAKEWTGSHAGSGQTSKESETSSGNSNSTQPEKAATASNQMENSNSSGENTFAENAHPEELQNETQAASKPSTSTQKSVSEKQEDKFKIRQIDVISPYLFTELAEDSLSKVAVPESPKELTGTRDHEVFAGAHVNFNLPLIFNQNTYGAFDGKELAYKPTFGLASGVRIGYTYKRQYGFQTGFIFYSSQGQKYEDKLNGYAAKRQVKLQYMQVPITLRYKFKIKKERKFESPWVINLGAQIGILQSAQITYDGNEYPLGTIINPETNDKDYFKPIDVSVVLGVEKEFYFTKWLMLSVGMRTAFSGDINSKDHPVMNDGKDYDKSHNFTFGFTLGLNYYLRR